MVIVNDVKEGEVNREIGKVSSILSMIGDIDSYKKLKSLVYIFSQGNDYFPYKWDEQFFGPQSSEFLFILETAVNNSYINEFFIRPEKEEYPIHHGFKPTAVTNSITQTHLQYRLDELKKNGIVDPNEFLSRMVALKALPTSIALNEALKISESKPSNARSESQDLTLSSHYLKMNYSINFNEENVGGLKTYYKKIGIDFKPIESEGNYEVDKVEFDIDKINSVVDKRYEYLRLENFHEEKIDWENMKIKLNDIGLEFDENKLEKYADLYTSNVWDKKYVSDSTKRLNRILNGLKDLLKESNDKESGLYTKFYFSSAFEITANPDLKKSIKKWNDSYLFDLYHLFQPFERVEYLNKKI